MDDKLMYIPIDNTQNYPLCRLKLVVGTFWHSNIEQINIKWEATKFFSQRRRKEDLCNKQSNVPSLSVKNCPLSNPSDRAQLKGLHVDKWRQSKRCKFRILQTICTFRVKLLCCCYLNIGTLVIMSLLE